MDNYCLLQGGSGRWTLFRCESGRRTLAIASGHIPDRAPLSVIGRQARRYDAAEKPHALGGGYIVGLEEAGLTEADCRAIEARRRGVLDSTKARAAAARDGLEAACMAWVAANLPWEEVGEIAHCSWAVCDTWTVRIPLAGNRMVVKYVGGETRILALDPGGFPPAEAFR